MTEDLVKNTVVKLQVGRCHHLPSKFHLKNYHICLTNLSTTHMLLNERKVSNNIRPQRKNSRKLEKTAIKPKISRNREVSNLIRLTGLNFAMTVYFPV